MKKRGMVSTYTSAALPVVIAAAALLCLPPGWQWTPARTWGAGLIIAAFVVRIILVLVEWEMVIELEHLRTENERLKKRLKGKTSSPTALTTRHYLS